MRVRDVFGKVQVRQFALRFSICINRKMIEVETVLLFDSGTLTLEGAGQEIPAPSVFQCTVLLFDSGTLTLEGAGQEFPAPSVFQWDERVRRWRAPAITYRQAVTALTRQNLAFKDEARRYYEFQFRTDLNVEPRPYQRDAIAAWQKGGKRGVVILPTGAGKSFVAQMAIEMTGRSTLVVVPT